MEFIIENVVYHKHFSLSRRHTSFSRRFTETDPAGAAFVLGASHRGVLATGLLPGKAKEGLTFECSYILCSYAFTPGEPTVTT